MAHGLFQKILQEKGIQDIEVLSAGIAAFPGDPASFQAVEAMKEYGIDLSGHKASFLTHELVKEADLILTMTEAHKRRIVSMVPQAAEKTFTLKEYTRTCAEEGLDIHDPFGQDVAVYRQCAAELKEELLRVVEKLENMGGDRNEDCHRQ